MAEQRPINYELAFRRLCAHVRQDVELNRDKPYEAAIYRTQEATEIYAYAEGIAEALGIELPPIGE